MHTRKRREYLIIGFFVIMPGCQHDRPETVPPTIRTTESAAETVALDELLVGDTIPSGYHTSTQEINSGDRVTGRMILLTKPDEVSKVVVRIELRDLSEPRTRRAAAKAYVNAFANSLMQSGYQVIEKEIPDSANETFAKPISVKLLFADKNGKKLWTHQEIFFSQYGFAVQVIAEDQDTLAKLVEWAKSVKPSK